MLGVHEIKVMLIKMNMTKYDLRRQPKCTLCGYTSKFFIYDTSCRYKPKHVRLDEVICTDKMCWEYVKLKYC